MHIELPRENLAELLYLTNTIVERKNTMPILANVKLTAEKDTLHVAATDLEVSLIGYTEAEVKTPGSITVSAKFIYDITRDLPDQTVTLKGSRGERLELESGPAQFKINGISSEEFPAIMGVSIGKAVSIEASKLLEMLEKTAYAVSFDETRYNINGVFIEIVDGALRFVATDGHRLAYIDRPSDGFELNSGVIIPRKGIQELRKVLDGNEGAAKLSISEGFATIQSGNVTLGVRLIDGEFPDYRQVIPDEEKTNFTIPKNEFLSIVKRVSLVTTDKSRSTRFKVEKGTLYVSSSSPEYGEAEESYPVTQEGEDVSIGFSAKYVIDLLSTMNSSEMITVKLNGELSPGVFIGDADEDYTCVVMPMRFD